MARPPMYGEKMIRGTVTLPPEVDADLRRLGRGNRSAGIRALWEAWRRRRQTKPKAG